MKPQHTPTPWKFSNEPAFQGFNKQHIAIFSGLNQTVLRSDYMGEANAALIVKAVNSHQALIDALEAVETRLGELLDSDTAGITSDTGKDIEELIWSIRTTLKTAKGE